MALSSLNYVRGITRRGSARQALRAFAIPRVVNGTQVTMRASGWFPGTEAPAHLDGSLAGDFGFDPLGLGTDPEDLKYFVEAELQHARWAMIAVAGIIGQSLLNPDVFWYEAATNTALNSPADILGILAVQFLCMHWIEIRRWRDVQEPNSMNADPIFSQYSLPDHEPGYPGGTFDFLNLAKEDLETKKLMELKHGRLAMLAFIGNIMAAQVTGKGPIENWQEHVASPWTTTIFNKALVAPGIDIQPACMIPVVTSYNGVDIPTPCLLQGLWP